MDASRQGRPRLQPPMDFCGVRYYGRSRKFIPSSSARWIVCTDSASPPSPLVDHASSGIKDTAVPIANAIGRSAAVKDNYPSNMDPASLLEGGGGVDRRVPRGELETRFGGGRRLPVEDPPVSEVAFPRFAPGGPAPSDRRDDLPCLLDHAHRCAVDENLARGNGHSPRVHRCPQRDARGPKKKNHDGCKDGFHVGPLPLSFPF